MRYGTPLLAVIWLLLTTVATANSDRDVPPEWRTVAEASGFSATSTYDETVELLHRIDAASNRVRLEFFGHSAAGRPLPSVIVSGDRTFTPRAAAAAGHPVVLIQSCIHAGEVDGKDASLTILRDIALDRVRTPEKVVVLFVPILNPDGHERMSKYNRPNQNGPSDGMGFRTTANGINLNRDHMRLQSAEMRDLVRLFNRWRPHLQVDIHVTNGADHGWVVTWYAARRPALAASLDDWLQGNLPSALEATERAGYPAGPYVNLRDASDPSRGIAWFAVSPRFSHDYWPLRNRPSILLEMHAHKPFRDRVLATRKFLIALVEEVDTDPAALTTAVAAAEAETVKLGRADAPPSEAVVRWKLSDTAESVRWLAYPWYLEDSVVSSKPLLRYRRGRLRELTVPWYRTCEPDLVVPRPRGYLVAPGWPQVERLLADHGLVVHQLAATATADVETMRVTDPEPSSRPYQGVVMIDRFNVRRQTERRTLPAGSLWIPADQPDFEVAVQLFEPEAPDSLLRWGLLSTAFERKEYIDRRTLEDVVAEMMKDERTRTAWERALEDRAFAADDTARYLWWYRRTPYWDDELGRLPIMRALTVPELDTTAWDGARQAP